MNIFEKFPDRIPIILKKESNKAPDFKKYKYLVPKDMILGTFIYHIRSFIKLEPNQSIFLFVNGKIYSSSTLIKDIYENEKDSEQYLIFYYNTENTFGN